MSRLVFIKIFFVLASIISALILISCSSRHDKQLAEIKKLEEKIKQQSIPRKEEGNTLVTKYLEFADAYPEDTLTPTILYNAARVAVSINNAQQGADILQRLIESYPESKPLADSYVFLGFIYETVLLDLQKAAYWYELFLKEFPNHPMYQDVRFSLNNLGKSPEELVADFLRQADEGNSKSDSVKKN